MNYFPLAKRHYVHDSVVDIVCNDVELRHGLLPDKEEVLEDSLRIDPGGMINMNSKPMVKDFDGCEVSIKPEHILSAAVVWTTHRILNNV
jgi:hypothetical protein